MAANVVEVAPLPMTTPLGIVRFALLLESDTAVQPTDGCESVTVHVLVPPGEMVPGAQLTDNGADGAFRLILAVRDVPFSEAVMPAAPLAENCWAVTENVALVEPFGTVTDAGAGRFPEFDERFTVAPVAPLSVTVQLLVAPGASVEGEHPKLLTPSEDALTPTVPPVPVTVNPVPVAEAPCELLTAIAAALLPAKVTVTVATTPSGIVVAFIP